MNDKNLLDSVLETIMSKKPFEKVAFGFLVLSFVPQFIRGKDLSPVVGIIAWVFFGLLLGIGLQLFLTMHKIKAIVKDYCKDIDTTYKPSFDFKKHIFSIKDLVTWLVAVVVGICVGFLFLWIFFPELVK